MCKLSYLNVDLYNAWAVHVAANGCEENSISEALELPGVVVHTIDEYGTEIVHINHASAACSVDSIISGVPSISIYWIIMMFKQITAIDKNR